MVTLPSQAKNTTTVKDCQRDSTGSTSTTATATTTATTATTKPHPIPSPQVAPKVAPKPVPAANVGANGVQAKIRAYNERDEIRKRTLSVEAPQQQEREREEEEEVMEIEAREIPQGRRHSVDSNIDFRPHGVHGQPLQLTYPGHPGHAPRSTDPSPRRRSVPMQPSTSGPVAQCRCRWFRCRFRSTSGGGCRIVPGCTVCHDQVKLGQFAIRDGVFDP
jgi:hypothetical protein